MARDVNVGSTGAAAPAPRSRGEAQAGSGGGNIFQHLWRFIHESVAELRKVEWPGQNQVIQGTVVVLIACLIVGTFLYVNDRVWKEVVSKVLLR
jgi:preprotein translocase SecE subunit